MSASGTGAFIGALVVATYGHLFSRRENSRSAASGYFRLAMLALSFTRNFPLALAVSLRRRIRHAAVFLNIKHRAANDRAG